MRIAFWNVQRLGALSNTSEDFFTKHEFKAGKWALACGWIESFMKTDQADVIVLAEVTQTGQKLLSTQLNLPTGYSGEFVPVEAKGSTVSPCSYLLLWKGSLDKFCIVGTDLKRPYLAAIKDSVLIGGFHAIANRNKSLDAIATVLTDIKSEMDSLKLKVGVVIGDMNYDYKTYKQLKNSYSLEKISASMIELAGWKAEAPGDALPQTHKAGGLLDFAWIKGGTATPYALFTGSYLDWDTIDHAPIAYDVV
jgi:hypothetical protein